MPDVPTICIIDDDASVRIGIGALVRSIGLPTCLFASAEAFLAAQPSCACIITDIQMPGMGGMALLEELAQRKSRVPVIVVTAFPESTIRARVLASGAAAFFAKPFDSNELVWCIERLLRDNADPARAT